MTLVPLGDIARHHAERKPKGALALIFPDGCVTWWDLERRANRRARLLAQHGVGAGDWVMITLANHCRFHEITLAIWKLGATPVVVSPGLPRQELDALVVLARPRLLVSDKLLDIASTPILASDHSTEAFTDDPLAPAIARHWKVMTSGGSTGRPKLIVDHAPAEIDPAEPAMLQNPDGTILIPGPLYHNAPFFTSHKALFTGCRLVGMARFDAEQALALIERHRVDWVTLVPTMMHRIWALPDTVRQRYDLSSLTAVWHLASAIPPWLKQAWIEWLGAERIYELYGGTEGQGVTWISGSEWLARPGSVGTIQGESQIGIFGSRGERLSPGAVGEIFIKMPNPDHPPYHYVGAEAKALPGGWESIGDLGWIDDDGYLFLADRRTDLILRGGANVYPAEIEAAIDAYPAVASSIVLGLPDADLGQRVHAIVQPAGDRLSLAALHDHLAERLAKYKLPESYELASDALRDEAGKARRSALRDERVARMERGEPFRRAPDDSPLADSNSVG